VLLIMFVTLGVRNHFRKGFRDLYGNVNLSFMSYVFYVIILFLVWDHSNGRLKVFGNVNFDNLWLVNDLHYVIILCFEDVLILGNLDRNHVSNRYLHLSCELHLLWNLHNLLFNVIFHHLDIAGNIVSDWHLDRLRHIGCVGNLRVNLLNVIHWLLNRDSSMALDGHLHLMDCLVILDSHLRLYLGSATASCPTCRLQISSSHLNAI